MLKTLFLPLFLMLGSTVVFGHHGLSRFDSSQVISLEGSVIRVEWVNPHVFITIEVFNENNEAVVWEIEGPPPAMLRRGGWTRETFQIGDSVIAQGNPTISESQLLYATRIEPVEGLAFDQSESISVLLSEGVPSETEARNLEGIWLTLLSPAQLAIYNGQGAAEGLTATGLASLQGFDEATMNPGVNCIQNPAPASMVMPDLKRISIESNTIRIESNYDSAIRTIYLGTDDSMEAEASNQGYTVGRWEGDTLIMESSHFSEHAMGNRWGVPSGSQKRLSERLTLNPDGRSITYYYELSDPEYLTDIVTGGANWVYRPNMAFETFECDLDASRRFLQ